jgi:Chlorite dismutase
MTNRFVFLGGDKGPWKVSRMGAVRGEGLAAAARIEVVNGEVPALPPGAAWALQGFTSNVRYASASEVAHLKEISPPLGRPEATRAALIPIKKTQAWWDLAQDRRREIFEETSHHNAIGIKYLPAVARRLHHSRDLGEPFDFLTWFEFAPEHEAEFDDLLVRLRATKEWEYVEREVEVRLER